MQIERKSPKIFFGWWTVLAIGIVTLVSAGFAGQSFSVFFKPISAELGLSRAVTSIAAGVQMVVGSIGNAIGGWGSDKYGPRRMMLIGIIIMIIGCFGMYFINSLGSFLSVIGGLVGLGFFLGLTIITDKAIINWFVKKAGLAVNVKFAITSLSGLAILPLVAWLINTYGWRETYVIAGIISAVVGIPLIWLFVKPHPPEYYGLLPDGGTKDRTLNQTAIKTGTGKTADTEIEFTFREAVKTPPFWILVLSGYVTGLVMPMMGAHCVPFLTDSGMSAVKAATMMGLATTSSIPARLLTGYVMDRMPTRYIRLLLAAGIFIQAIGVTAFLVTGKTSMIFLWFVLHGIGSGMSQSVQLPLFARYYGRKAFGTIAGLQMPLQLPVGLIAPIWVGYVFDTSGSYMSVIRLMPILLTISAVITLFVLPPKPAARAVKAR